MALLVENTETVNNKRRGLATSSVSSHLNDAGDDLTLSVLVPIS